MTPLVLCVSFIVYSSLADTTPSSAHRSFPADTSAVRAGGQRNGGAEDHQEKTKPVVVSPGTRATGRGVVEIVPWSLFTAEEVDSIILRYPSLRRAVLQNLIAGGVPGPLVWALPRTLRVSPDALRLLPMSEFERLSLSGERYHALFDNSINEKITAPQVSAIGAFQRLYELLK